MRTTRAERKKRLRTLAAGDKANKRLQETSRGGYGKSAVSERNRKRRDAERNLIHDLDDVADHLAKALEEYAHHDDPQRLARAVRQVADEVNG